jgi:hypothetical protein
MPAPLMYINDPLDGNKCHGREDLRCLSISQTDAICAPVCGKDEQCDGGRVCDPRNGVCVDPAKVNKGDKTGAKCDPMGMTPTCAGVCIGITGAANPLSMCTSPCGLGGNLINPDTMDCGGVENGLCVFSPTGYAPGDQGFCTNACKQHDDCQNPDWWCFSTNFNKVNGYCFVAPDCKMDSDCVDSMTMMPLKQKCIQTKYGGKCIDPLPLGSAAPGMGGSGSTGATSSATGSSSSSTAASSSSASTGAGGAGGK